MVSRRDLLQGSAASLVTGTVAVAMGGAAAATESKPAEASGPSPEFVTGTPRLFFTEEGEGERQIVFLHGWACDSHDWSWQLPAFAARHRCLAVDLRGHGRSEVTADGYAPEDFVADVIALIEARAAGQPVTLVGHSMGGQIAVRLAAARPDLASALVLADATIGLPESFEKPYRDFCDAMDKGIPGEVAPPLFRALYTAESSPALIEWHRRRLQGMAPHVLRQSIRPLFLGPGQVAMGRASEEICRKVACPVYAIHRSESRAGTVRPWFKNEKSIVVPWVGSGHWVQLDRPEVFNDGVLNWLETL